MRNSSETPDPENSDVSIEETKNNSGILTFEELQKTYLNDGQPQEKQKVEQYDLDKMCSVLSESVNQSDIANFNGILEESPLAKSIYPEETKSESDREQRQPRVN
jgi:hypothetical protein